MNCRKFNRPKSELVEEGKAIIKSSNDFIYIYRVTLVTAMIEYGISPSKFSEIFKESKNTLTLWIKKVNEIGFESLRPKAHPGRPSRLSPSQIDEIKIAVNSDPLNYGYNVWEGKTLSHLIKSKFDIDLKVRQCQNLLHKMGFSLIRPRQKPEPDDPEKKNKRAIARDESKKN